MDYRKTEKFDYCDEILVPIYENLKLHLNILFYLNNHFNASLFFQILFLLEHEQVFQQIIFIFLLTTELKITRILNIKTIAIQNTNSGIIIK